MCVSDAMMRALPLDEMHAKADGLYRWADYTFAQHVHTAGYGLTYPHVGVARTGSMDHSRYHLFGHDLSTPLFSDAHAAMRSDKLCGPRNALCNWTLTNAVSFHLRHKASPETMAGRVARAAASLHKALTALGEPSAHLRADVDPQHALEPAGKQ
uniref:Uncharacterized protein n=1 Tax=Chlamydomonas euryale TaxID=1486919 RepID=A0A7R9YYT6_9CHLO